MSRAPRAAIGLKAHTGWAYAVVVAEAGDTVEVLAKQRLTMLAGFKAAAVYHRGYEEGLSEAEMGPILETARRRSAARAEAALRAIAAAADRCALDRAAILGSAGKPLPPLGAVLRSHPLVHSAEGELYRGVLAQACEALGLEVSRVPSKGIGALAASRLQVSEKSLLERLAKAGAASGRPWAADQRECALAAWTALAS